MRLSVILTLLTTAGGLGATHCVTSYSTQQVVVAQPAVALVPSFSFQFLPAVQALAPAVQAPPPVVVDDGPPMALLPGDQVQATAPQPVQQSGVLATYCQRCHQGPSGRGGVSLFDESGRFAPTVSPDRIFDSVDSGRMPKGSPLPPEGKLAVARALLTGK